MSVVNKDWRDPASWLKPKIAYGMVKDGSVLRACRITKSGKKSFFTCQADAWESDTEFRPRFEKEHQSGALLAVGIEPHRVMLRTLESPLKDREKSTEIWGTLLDAAIPFSLEKCQVTFLPAVTRADGGLQCLAVAARMQDLEELLTEWQASGLDPDLIFPEELTFPEELVSPDRKQVFLWQGKARTVFSSWRDGQYAEGGGALQPAQREKILSRFEQSRSPDAEPVKWERLGPDADHHPEIMEQALASAALKEKPLHANLRSEPIAAAALLNKYTQKRKTLKISAFILIFLLFLFPLLLRHQLRAHQKFLRAEISREYQHFTGSVSNAPGMEVLLATRYRDEKWSRLWTSVQNLSRPRVSNSLVEIMSVARENSLTFMQIELRRDFLDLQVLANEEDLKKFENHLRVSGWEMQVTSVGDGVWNLKGRRGE